MNKILAFTLALGATVLMACPNQQGMMNCGNGAMMMQKCQCDTTKLPKHLENLGLSDQQKEHVQKLRDEGKAFHNQQHEKMMAILTPEQRAKLDAVKPMKGAKQPLMPVEGMKCKACDNK